VAVRGETEEENTRVKVLKEISFLSDGSFVLDFFLDFLNFEFWYCNM
jgi:hypothetical protein